MSENSERFQAPDTSHYDDCRSLLQSIRLHRTIRFVIAVIFSVISLFIHTMPMILESTAISAIFGVLSLPFSVLVIWLAVLARSEDIQPNIRLMGVLAAGAVLQVMNAGAAITLIIIYATQIPETKRLTWLKTQEGYPHFEHYITIQEYGLEEYHPHHDTDERKYSGDMIGLSDNEQDKLNTPQQTVMPSAEVISELKAPPAQEMPARPEIAVPAAFAGISPMDTEKPESRMEQATSQVLADLPQPENPVPQKKKRSSYPWLETSRPKKTFTEPEVPAVDFDVPKDIPDPVWDIPDPVLDTSAVVSSFPEIAGDIADLPEIPDIPQI